MLLLFPFCVPTPSNRDTCHCKVHCMKSLYTPYIHLSSQHANMAHSLFPVSNHSQSNWGPASSVTALGETGCTMDNQGTWGLTYGSFRHFICPGHSQQTGTTELNSEILLNTAKDILNSPVHPHLIIFILNPRVPFPGSQQVSELPLPPFLASIITKKCQRHNSFH